MPRVEPKTVAILRRMMRKSIGFWSWNAFGPSKAAPEELRFDLLDGNSRLVGNLVCTEFPTSHSPKYAVKTPWGEGRIEFSRGAAHISLNSQELGALRASSSKNRVEFVSPRGAIMEFDRTKGRGDDLIHSSEDWYMGFFAEAGTLPENAQNRRMAVTRDEIKALPKKDRPRSIETNNYVQYRIDVGGALPIRQDDIVRALCIFVTYRRIVHEL